MTPTRADPLKFSLADAQHAAGGWFNCGPGALCAVAGLHPCEALPHLRDFERKHYTNPSMMADALRSLGLQFVRRYESPGSDQGTQADYPDFGLVRIQWGGPWTKPGVPVRARYWHTHWVGWAKEDQMVFDINAMCVGGWLDYAEWSAQLIPWLLREVEPKASGEWWPTHCWDVFRGS